MSTAQALLVDLLELAAERIDWFTAARICASTSDWVWARSAAACRKPRATPSALASTDWRALASFGSVLHCDRLLYKSLSALAIPLLSATGKTASRAARLVAS